MIEETKHTNVADLPAPLLKQTGLKSLHAQHHFLADPSHQVAVLKHGAAGHGFMLTPFQQQLEDIHLFPLRPTGIEVFQVNMGKMCNQVCKHCHVDAGPDRKEIMTKETMQQCLDTLKNKEQIKIVDLT